MQWPLAVTVRGYVVFTTARMPLSVSTRMSPSRAVSVIPAYSFVKIINPDTFQVVGACRQIHSSTTRSKVLRESTARPSPTSSTFAAPAATALSAAAKKASSLLPIAQNASVSMISLPQGSVKYKCQRQIIGETNVVHAILDSGHPPTTVGLSLIN
jgi:hypothetical protein